MASMKAPPESRATATKALTTMTYTVWVFWVAGMTPDTVIEFLSNLMCDLSDAVGWQSEVAVRAQKARKNISRLKLPDDLWGNELHETFAASVSERNIQQSALYPLSSFILDCTTTSERRE